MLFTDREKMLVSVVSAVRDFYACAEGRENVNDEFILGCIEDNPEDLLEDIEKTARKYCMNNGRSSFNEDANEAYCEARRATNLLVEYHKLEERNRSRQIESVSDVADTICEEIDTAVTDGETDISALVDFCRAWNNYSDRFCWRCLLDVRHITERGRIIGISFNDDSFYL